MKRHGFLHWAFLQDSTLPPPSATAMVCVFSFTRHVSSLSSPAGVHLSEKLRGRGYGHCTFIYMSGHALLRSDFARAPLNT
jgi:hypothetical protein